MSRKIKPNLAQSARLIPMREAAERVLFTPTHLYRLIRSNKFPVPVKLGRARIGFIESEIDEYIAECAAHRTTLHKHVSA